MVDIPGGIGISLKEIESNLGMSIEESSVSFDIERKLTEEEIKETIFYCKHDVDATERLFRERFDYVKSKLLIINKFKLPMKCIGMTNAQLTAEVMHARKIQHNDSDRYDMPDCVKTKNKKILKFFENPLDNTQSMTEDVCGVEHIIAYGGLHGARKKYHCKDNIYNFDVGLTIWLN